MRRVALAARYVRVAAVHLGESDRIFGFICAICRRSKVDVDERRRATTSVVGLVGISTRRRHRSRRLDSFYAPHGRRRLICAVAAATWPTLGARA